MLFIKKLIFIAIFLLLSFSYALEYDGLWFLGFNLNSERFKGDDGKKLRYYINYSIDKNKIVEKLDGVVPNDIIPKGMNGYDSRASLPVTAVYDSSELPELKVLITDGLLTKAIFSYIKSNLLSAGIKLKAEAVDYSNGNVWQNKLSSGNYDLFFMGYKTFGQDDGTLVLNELFAVNGEANFTGYNQFENITLEQFEKAKWKIISDLPLIPLFYIKNIKEIAEN